MLDDHSTWDQSDVSEDEARQIVRDVTRQAGDKSIGSVPGHLKEILKALDTPVVRWREILRNLIGTYVGNKRLTYARRNRRYNRFGVPGVSHHKAATLSIVVDTSGSVSSRMLEKFFAEIEAVAYRARISVLQWDHAFQGYGRYRRGDWKKIDVRGRGGTDMAAPVAWLEEQGLIGDACVMLTDGIVSGYPPQRPYPMIFCLAYTGDNKSFKVPEWGNIIEIKCD
jgi:predicted metal-dependent peptidase